MGEYMFKKIIILVSSILCFSCNKVETTTQEIIFTIENNLYKEKLTKDNLWYYFDYELSSELNKGSSEELFASFNGILLNALYSNVIIYFSLYYRENEITEIESHNLKLKANGDGYFSLSSYYLTSDNKTLSNYNRYLYISGVEGQIIF